MFIFYVLCVIIVLLMILLAIAIVAPNLKRRTPRMSYRSYKRRNPFPAQTRLTFAVAITNGITLSGDITNMNLQAGEKITLRARPTHKGRPAKYQIGSARLEDNLPEGFFKVTHNPTGANELEVQIIALEETGDEVLPAVGAVALVIDADPSESVRELRAETAVNWIPFGASTFEFDEGARERATEEELAGGDEDEDEDEGAGDGTGAPEGGDQT